MANGLFTLKQQVQALQQGAWSGYIAPKWVEYLVVAGGGSGGSNNGGGGGAGGLLTGIVTVAAGTSYTVTVGAGGAGVTVNNAGNAGVSSVFGSISATGGGRGGGYGGAATSGGSGGGGGGGQSEVFVAQGTAGQGNTGSAGQPSTSPYVGGGGGGAGTVATTFAGSAPAVTGGGGGSGIASSISGTVVVYSGGGGGSIGSSGSFGGSGGVGGGGGGPSSSSANAGSGTANTGGGGGGAGTGTSGSGGSGIVVVRYPGNVQFFTGGTVNYNNGYIIHIFTSSGTLAPTTPTVYNTSYQISRSLRFNSADSTYLNRTPASATNRRTWTWSAWVKRSALGTIQELFDGYWANTDNGYFWVGFTSSDAFEVQLYNSTLRTTTQVFRDPSAWYHFVLAVDTTQATAANRVKVYLNGSEITTFSTNNAPTQNLDTAVNYNGAHYIGTFSGTTNLFNGYQTEINLIDGQALTPSSFGATSTTTGVWAPIQYTGTYGTNGFYLNFSDNSNTTAATLGKDYSGNGNNWTPNNFSVTSGVGNDSLVDTPTPYGFDTGVGGTVRGNYCTLNPLTTTAGTYTQGNLQYAAPNSWRRSNATISRATGQWYWEVTLANAPYPIRANGEWNAFGFGLSTVFDSTATPPLETDAVILTDSGYYKNFSGSYTDTGVAFASGDVLSIAVDLDANTFTFRRNNTSLATGTIGGTAGRELVPIILSYSNAYGLMDCNFGQRPFAYTAPSGYKALCTQNLPTPTIGATSTTLATKYFNPVTWTGTGTSSARSITGVGFQPDFVWSKPRSTAYQHNLYDVIRGSGKRLISNSTDAEATNATYGYLSSFDSDGFSTSAGATNNENWNETNATYVAWNWKANGSGSTNTAGSINSQVSASPTSGVSVVTWTGNSGSGTVGHGLGVAPAMYIVKNRTNAGGWVTYHSALGATKYLTLQSTDAATTSSIAWGNTEPTSTVFSINSGAFGNSNNYLTYCFAPVAGFSAFGSYIGNNSTDGTFTYTGFRPAFIMIKCNGGGTSWVMYDAARNTYNATTSNLMANTTDAEATTYSIDLLSNGFKIRSLTSNLNDSGLTYIYAAFASNPFKYSLAR